MNPAAFTYGPSILFGYLLFVGISGRLDPLSCPRVPAERPAWALGLWTGVAAFVVTLVGLQRFASGSGARAALVPGVLTLSAVFLSGLLVCVWCVHRRAAARSPALPAGTCRDAPSSAARIDGVSAVGDETTVEPATGLVVGPASGRDAGDDEASREHPLVATFLDVGGPERLDIPDIPVARADLEIALDAGGVAVLADSLVPSSSLVDAVARAEHEAALEQAESLNGTLTLSLRAEKRLRRETEKHLRIVRRALSRLEAEACEHERERANADRLRADTLIALEEELESRIGESAMIESDAERETSRRIEAEKTVLVLEQDVSSARRSGRRDRAARARAMSTATRSIALTRQAVRARSRLEERTRELEETLADRETTLGNVVRALEREKSRTREEIGTLARQLVLQERQLRARRALEGVARGVEGRTTTRLARKVARARPLVPSN